MLIKQSILTFHDHFDWLFLKIFYFLGSTVLSVKVLDINDNAPVFSEPEYKAALNETSPVGAFVVQVSFISDLVDFTT